MKIQTGHTLTKDVVQVESSRVSFMADDGRTLFEVACGKDGKSLEIRGVEACKVDGVLYSECFYVKPNCANVVEIVAIPYK